MTKRKRKLGRPTRGEASKRALADVDVKEVNPVAILRTIAADASVPASARVAAAKALLTIDKQGEQTTENQPSGADAVSRAALRILQGGKA